MKTKSGILLFLFAALLIVAKPLLAFDHQHQLFDRLLKQAVVVKGHQSQVDYSLIKRAPGALNRYVEAVEAVSLSEYKSWQDQQKMAFLINAYNALTIKLILKEYPDLDSIKDIGGFFSSPWKLKFFRFLGEERYLDYIEHEMLRVDFSEPRIHFALVCASKGCPPLRNEAFVADRLESQLEAATLNFLKDFERNRFNKKERTLEISSIFKWFSEDFETKSGSVEAFIAPYLTSDPEFRSLIRSGEMDMDFLSYDWSLNDVK